MPILKFARRLSLLTFLAMLFLTVPMKPSLAQYPENQLPENAAAALANATEVTLYSLESELPKGVHEDGFYRYKILGKTKLSKAKAKEATGAFQKAISTWGTHALCFEPHHALRVIADGHTYDYLLCYSCNGIVVFEDSKRIADLSISGSPDILNALLTTAHVPLSYIYSPQYITAEKKRMQDEKDADARWLAAMPTSFQPLWAKAAQEMFFESTPPPPL